ncbi:MAG: hypothetical protein QOF76_4600 [Solirubrobacteraceae bacterium]|nr:hypothetical protein [Solirubrobacteraceae bacterium]
MSGSRVSKLLMVVAATGAIGLPAAAADAKPAKPSKAVIGRLLTKVYVGSFNTDYPGNHESVKVNSVAYGATHIGKHRADGTPVGSTTTVFPVKVNWDFLRSYSDGSTGNQHVTGKYKVFRDEFHEWVLKTTGDETRTDF